MWGCHIIFGFPEIKNQGYKGKTVFSRIFETMIMMILIMAILTFYNSRSQQGSWRGWTRWRRWQRALPHPRTTELGTGWNPACKWGGMENGDKWGRSGESGEEWGEMKWNGEKWEKAHFVFRKYHPPPTLSWNWENYILCLGNTKTTCLCRWEK